MAYADALARIQAGQSAYRLEWIFNKPRKQWVRMLGGQLALITDGPKARLVESGWTPSEQDQHAKDWKTL